MSSERASPHEANSAGCRVTWALEKSRTEQARRDHVSRRIEEVRSGVPGRATGLHTLDLLQRETKLWQRQTRMHWALSVLRVTNGMALTCDSTCDLTSGRMFS
jgi:hypothetical protein